MNNIRNISNPNIFLIKSLFYMRFKIKSDINCKCCPQCTNEIKCTILFQTKTLDKVSNFLASPEQPGLNKIYLCNKQIIFNLYVMYMYILS